MSTKKTYEQASAELEEIVKKMESGDITLVQSMKLYEQAYTLLSFCMTTLEECSGQIKDINERIDNIKNSKKELYSD